MNRTLVTSFMGHLDESPMQSYQHENQRNLNWSFWNVFQWFLARYGVSNEMECQENKNRTEANWNPSNGVGRFINQINSRLLYVTFVLFPIFNQDTVDMAMRVVTKTWLFKEAYGTQHRRLEMQHAWFVFNLHLQTMQDQSLDLGNSRGSRIQW